MRILTLTQPWATLVAIGAKKIETRGWRAGYRGPIAIHAAIGLKPIGGEEALWRLCAQPAFFRALEPHVRVVHRRFGSESTDCIDVTELPRGAIVAVAKLVDVRPITPRLPAEMGFTTPERTYRWELTEQERAFGDYTPGRFAWLLADVRPLSEPLTYRGAQGLTPLNPEVIPEVLRRAA